MEERGVDVCKSVKAEALILLTAQEAYLQGGHFSPDFMLSFLHKAAVNAKRAGFRKFRGAGEMTCPIESNTDMELLVEYEAKVNYIFEEEDCVALCQYNINNFSQRVLTDILYTHPMVMYNNAIIKNLYYIPPDEYLKNNGSSVKLERMLLNLMGVEDIITEYKNKVMEVISNEIADKLGKIDYKSVINEKLPMDPRATKLQMLTKREREVLRLMTKGLTTNKLAEALNITNNTVALHKANMMKKLSIHKTLDLVLFGINNLSPQM
ncbi:MAG: MEDS domain-containing protein [Nitrospirae bacterium]|nr:MEDS domain-containing protein [Nitrospirota bacterium]